MNWHWYILKDRVDFNCFQSELILLALSLYHDSNKSKVLKYDF